MTGRTLGWARCIGARIGALCIGALCIGALCIAGCTAPGPSTSATGATGAFASDAGGSSTGGTGGIPAGGGDAGDAAAGGGGGALEPCDELDWPGWVRWKHGPDFCRLCVPGSTDALPSPITWEPCGDQVQLPSGACQQMVVDWHPKSNVPFSWFSVDTSGFDPVIDVVRASTSDSAVPHPHRVRVIAEADGAVLSAMMSFPSDECYLAAPHTGVRQGSMVGAVRYEHPDAPGTFDDVLFGGPWSQLYPDVIAALPGMGGVGMGCSAGVFGTWDSGKIMAAKWGSPLEQIHSGADDGLQQLFFSPWDDVPMWQASSQYYQRFMAYTAEKGAYVLLDPTPPYDRIWALGYDGVDMVWIGEIGAAGEAQVRDILWSPFTFEPTQVLPARLRAFPDLYYSLPDRFVVGCGYAAYYVGDGVAMITRLSDGAAWFADTGSCDQSKPAKERTCFDMPRGITCDEVFFEGGYYGVKTIYRVRLDSLGDPLPPD